MGWWSTTIMGGDTPLDFKDTFNSIAGINPSYSKNPTSEDELPKLIESLTEEFLDGRMNKILKKWGCGRVGSDYYNDKLSIGYQVLAVMYITSGAKLDESLKDIMLKWIPRDVWATEDTDRKSHITNLTESLKNYDGSDKIVVLSEGLFEVIQKNK
tara:strand:- start:14 stop:481 length:468 start_codon:yes stop_codon:yes gene_type:complete